MVLTQCTGGAACFCPVVPAHYPDCFVIWGWVVLTVFIISSMTFVTWYIWSTFFKVSATVSATQRLQRQNTFWVLTFCFIPTQIVMALTMHRDDPIQLAAWLVLAAIAGVWYAAWSLRRKQK